MDPGRLPRAAASAMASILVAGCTIVPSVIHRTQGHLSDGKTFVMDLYYGGGNAVGVNATLYADVAPGTAATVELTGTQHWRCTGKFQSHEGNPWPETENLPELNVSFLPPAGSYTVTARIASKGGEVHAPATPPYNSGPDAQTGMWVRGPGCVLIADTAAQQRAYLKTDLKGLRYLVLRVNRVILVQEKLRGMLDGVDAVLAPVLSGTAPDTAGTVYPIAAQKLRALRAAAVDAEIIPYPPDLANGDPLPPSNLPQLEAAIDETIAMLDQSGLK